MRARIFFAVVLSAMLIALPAQAFAATWNLATDYLARADSAQPVVKDVAGNSVWYFKDGDSPTNPAGFSASNLVWTTSFSWMGPTSGLMGWVRTPGGLPHVSVNASGVDKVSTTSPPFTWKAGKVLSHPMPLSDPWTYSVVEWKSPVAGNASASITLTDVDTGGTTGFEYWVLKNSTVLDHVVVSEGASGTSNLPSVPMVAGDSIYVVLGPGPDGVHSWDSTQMDITINMPDPPSVSTPASSAWSIALLALLGVAIVVSVRGSLVRG
jgi:hypothetical protein